MGTKLVDHVKRIKKLGKRPKLADPLLGLIEEIGEVAEAMNHEDHGKKKALKETSAEEMVDVIIQAFELFFDRGGTWGMLDRKMTQKIGRWESRLDGRNAGTY